MKKIMFLFFCFILVNASTLKAQTADITENIRKYIELNISSISPSGQESISCRQLIPEYYLEHQFVPIWKNVEHAKQLTKAIKSSYDEGLIPEDYHFKYLSESLAKSEEIKAEIDVLLSDAYFLLATHLLRGKVNPESIDAEWKATRREIDLKTYLNEAILNNSVDGSLASLLPTYKTYTRLKRALSNYRQIEYDGGWKQIAAGETLKLGMSDPRVIDLKNRLIFSGDLKARVAVDENYDELAETAVKRFQKRHGLTADGNVGAGTLEMLNIPVEKRIEQVIINMERCRWLPTELGEHYVLVNIANYELEAVKNGEVELEMDVVVGKPFRKTPVFSSQMVYLVFNPYWTVPPTIFDNDIVPAVRKNSRHLSNLNIKVVSGYGVNEKIIDPSSIDWKAVTSRNFPYMLRQDPGPNNALGLVKFIFPNPYNVYMHDTNHRELFVNTDRALSSGCIRLSKPLEFAEYILKNQPVAYDMERINSVVAKEKNQTILIQPAINVHLLYWTAFVDEAGLINFRKDIYERDKALSHALSKTKSIL